VVVECLLEYCPPRWAGVTEEVQNLVGTVCLAIASSTSDHGKYSMLGLDPRPKQCAEIESSQAGVVSREVEQYLRRGGPDINARTEFGDTALSLAVRNGHTDAVKCLRNRGVV
jgi:ankyrin repeat protein